MVCIYFLIISKQFYNDRQYLGDFLFYKKNIPPDLKRKSKHIAYTQFNKNIKLLLFFEFFAPPLPKPAI